MIIDAHTHIGSEGGLEATPEALIASMDQTGIDKALVLASEMFAYPTPRLLEAIQPYAGRLYAIGSVSPFSKELVSLEQVESWLQEKQIHGLKFYTGYEHFYPADEIIRPYLTLLEKYDRPAIFHSGDTFSPAGGAKLKYAHPLHIDDLAAEMPDLKIVIAHIGYPWVVDAGEVCYKNKHVYVDCSGFVYGDFNVEQQEHFSEVVKQYIKIAGTADKILFGTDWPISHQPDYIRVVESLVGESKERVFAQNVAKLFNI